jgi:hypothetical protein
MYKRKAEGKKMGLFISQSIKGPVSEHPRKCASVTKFVSFVVVGFSDSF